jgi:hypothetical protein
MDSGAGLSNATLQQRLVPVRLFCDFLVEEGVRDSNPVGRGAYTPGRQFGAGSGSRPLVQRMVKLPWIPAEPEWLATAGGLRVVKRFVCGGNSGVHVGCLRLRDAERSLLRGGVDDVRHRVRRWLPPLSPDEELIGMRERHRFLVCILHSGPRPLKRGYQPTRQAQARTTCNPSTVQNI